MIRVAHGLTIPEEALEFRFVRASGPGGQNVNKVATAVQLRVPVNALALPEDALSRLVRLAGRRLNQEGVLVIEAQRFRTQERNRQDAVERLVLLLQKAMERPKPRRPTKPGRGAVERRLASKEKQSRTKRLRGKVVE